MDIAVIIGEVGFISHKDVIDGILDKAFKADVNVFLFTCEGWRYSENVSYAKGEYNIFNLPNMKNYDGVIVDFGTIYDDEAKEVILQKLGESNIPVVSINIPTHLSRSAVVELENSSGIFHAVEHLVQVHGAKKIHFISGPQHNRDARERKDTFFEAMNRMGIDCGEESVFYGDFEYQSGHQIIKHYVKNGWKLPDAFLAANDYMAIGAMQELNKQGYRVPEDVLVMGYDDCSVAGYIQPRLSTVRRDGYRAGQHAFRMLHKLIEGRECERVKVVAGVNVFSESCGCKQRTRKHTHELLNALTDEKIYNDHNLEALKAMIVEFSKIKSFSEFSMQLQETVEQMELEFF